MATIKSYTDISQSQKLAEILPLESADMEYILEQWIDEKTYRHKEAYCEIPVVKVEDDCPLQPITLDCWSLTALLYVLPTLDGRNAVLCKDIRYDEWHICYHSTATLSVIDTERYNNPVDACYEMIIRLHEQNLL